MNSHFRSERFIPPVALPTGLPGRHYFLMQPPLDAAVLDPDDRVACQAAYDDVKAAVEDGVRWLRSAREGDPWRAGGPRLAYELTTGQPAPPPPFPESGS